MSLPLSLPLSQVAELLLKAGAAVNTPSGSNNDIPLTSACWKGHHHVVTLLLQHGSQIEHRTKDGCTPLMLAARSVTISEIHHLISVCVRVCVCGWVLIFLYIVDGYGIVFPLLCM